MSECPKCGYSREPADDFPETACPGCGVIHARAVLADQEVVAPVAEPAPAAPSAAEAKRFQTVFSGCGAEYFRIWIVNIFLTIITCGIYGAWAKVRTRRYFYANTTLASHPFEYLANPLAILKGNLIIGAGVLLYIMTQAFTPLFNGLVVLAAYLVFPFLAYKSLRFYAHNSAFRNIRFRFVGTLGEAYKIYLLIPVLIPFTLGLIIPYWSYRRKKYFFDNVSFGNSPYKFEGGKGYFYKIYLAAFLLIFSMVFIPVLLIGLVAVLIGLDIQGAATEIYQGMFIAVAGLIYIVFIVAFMSARQYIHARLTNYCWNQGSLAGIKFESTLSARYLAWIMCSNVLAIVFSLGLLVPWAKVRRARYILDNFAVVTAQGFDEFGAIAEPEESAVGDSAVDFFDLEIGL